jgi:hypothetical protein
MVWLIVVLVVLAALWCLAFAKNGSAFHAFDPCVLGPYNPGPIPNNCKWKQGESYRTGLLCDSVPFDAKNFHVPDSQCCGNQNGLQKCYNAASTATALCKCAKAGKCPNATAKNWGTPSTCFSEAQFAMQPTGAFRSRMGIATCKANCYEDYAACISDTDVSTEKSVSTQPCHAVKNSCVAKCGTASSPNYAVRSLS